MRIDGHFGQLKLFTRRVYIFEWNVLRSKNVSSLFWKNYRISIHKMNF
jgi:hypothetical protein